ncbi:Uncharacterised protein [Mycobacteroides abscessus subsp. abscessus]|nr:Uncharacterised protein [Mycobacteroides abscessus subsp. abscessus]
MNQGTARHGPSGNAHRPSMDSSPELRDYVRRSSKIGMGRVVFS